MYRNRENDLPSGAISYSLGSRAGDSIYLTYDDEYKIYIIHDDVDLHSLHTGWLNTDIIKGVENRTNNDITVTVKNNKYSLAKNKGILLPGVKYEKKSGEVKLND